MYQRVYFVCYFALQNKLIKVDIPDECSALPAIFNLRTEIKLPVQYLDTVTVDCESGYSHTGDRTITCIKDNNFQFNQLPRCVLGTFRLCCRLS